ncbi:MAG: NUDIX hydrolase [Brachybacterium tyrofermentans]|uniref:NUDIX domain-containing protein n=1 Tax=Brachybacterium tyrofermentans TaxID=47848 RepID=A0ABW0FKS3_9MICO|nr:NUDIX domain-containing protein [Brachybacterium tyrofermentans]
MATPEFVLALREHVGHAPLWLSGVTAFVLDPARTRMLAVRRADTGAWTPVTGIIDPGEEPATAAVREVAEEAGVDCTALRLVDVRTHAPITYANGDVAQYLDLCFLCEHDGGEPYPADGENTQAQWFPIDAPPPMNDRFLEQLELIRADRPEARFRR